MNVEIMHGDCLDILPSIEVDFIDAVVTDPPYGLGFMGKHWDHAENVAFRPETWAAVLRVMKPGAHLVAFGGTRTYHRLVCAIEDAGFEIRDQIGWAFGQGFPKSHNQGDGWGTALKPAWEPICLARKPLSEGTVAANVMRWGTGAINIDATRILNDDYDPSKIQRQKSNRVTWEGGAQSGLSAEHEQPTYNSLGRWPANLVHDGSPEVLACFPETGKSTGGQSSLGAFRDGKIYGSGRNEVEKRDPGFGDSGSAARFFYCAKASKHDRADSKHPTVKPVTLIRWLVRLITPVRGTILDPFAGSGTTGQAAIEERMNAILIERESEYCVDIRNRLNRATKQEAML